eukprot:TRINITY_DN47180_c0_g1_i1.p1 TRINITY_DN47180_c0_g1~~TRINITY_DN47180_c0_g1_i1.p1  ORF type:complete len:818 (+),score=248.09 TRINITY_DN47180_c0_g1_i1:230-2683(+)
MATFAPDTVDNDGDKEGGRNLDKRKSLFAGGGAAAGAASDPAIKVCVRVRPFIKEELEGERAGADGNKVTQLCIAMPDMSTTEVFESIGTPLEMKKTFRFDRCYWSHSSDHPHYATQETLMEELGEAMLEGALAGYNNCIFAYGQTGSGKSYSVIGGQGDQRGLLPRVVEGLFKKLDDKGKDVECKTLVAFIEIYNEQVKDLLTEAGANAPTLRVTNHPTLGMTIPGLTKSPVNCFQDVMDLVDYGNTLRHTAATAMNATSSRSHCVFTFEITITEGAGRSKMSKTNLVDLAGSERSSRTKATGAALQEGNMINKSLTTLARVIMELAKKNKKAVPFRDSRLTMVLKESLSGNSKTAMMAAISPNVIDLEETVSTLNFAQSVKMIKTKAVVNKVDEAGMEAQLRTELAELKEQLMAYESEKLEDMRRLSVAHRRIVEQEALVESYSKDWATRLQEERVRKAKRCTLGKQQDELASLQERFAHVGGDLEGIAEGDSDSERSSTGGADNAVTLCYIDYSLSSISDSRTASSLAGRTRVVVHGPGAQQLRKLGATDDGAITVSTRLLELKESCTAAQAAANSLSDPTKPCLRLLPMLSVDPDTLETELTVRCWRGTHTAGEASDPGAGTTEEDANSDCGAATPRGARSKNEADEQPLAGLQILTPEELNQRLCWLQEQDLDRNMKAFEAMGDANANAEAAPLAAPLFDDAWEQSGKMTASVGGQDAGQEQPKKDEELDALRAQLARAQTENAFLKAQLEAARKAEERPAAKTDKVHAEKNLCPRAQEAGRAVTATFDAAIAAIEAAMEASRAPSLQVPKN